MDYNIKMSTAIEEGYNNKLKSKLFHLLCEREENGEWQKFLDSILIELMGVEEEEQTINYYILFRKLAATRYLDYTYFRSTIFDCMSLVGRGL